MSRVVALADHLAPDSIRSLRRAAALRVEEADALSAAGHPTAAIYLLGYAVEMCLGAAAFRVAGHGISQPITREERWEKANQLKRTTGADGRPLMTSDAHDFVGWARYLEWQHPPDTDDLRTEVVRDAVRRARIVYEHWRPELRYKTTAATPTQLSVVRREADWFIQEIDTL